MICNACATDKPLTDFPASPTKLGVRKKCKVCFAEYMRNYYSNNPEQYQKHKGFVRRNDKEYKRQWSRHGLTEQCFCSMMDKFDGKCWGCKIRDAKTIDHDHNCCPGAFSCGDCVRGLLCIGCNSALGQIYDSMTVLENLIEYLNHAPRVAGGHK